MAVEGINPGGRSFERSRSSSCISGRARVDRRAWHDGRNRNPGWNWRDRRQYSEFALPDGPAIELDRHSVDGINRAFVPKVGPDVTGSIDPRSRWHSRFINKAEVPAMLCDECGLIKSIPRCIPGHIDMGRRDSAPGLRSPLTPLRSTQPPPKIRPSSLTPVVVFTNQTLHPRQRPPIKAIKFSCLL